jgi:hypothetical protein
MTVDQMAREYWNHGLRPIPLRTNGSKAPDMSSWKKLREGSTIYDDNKLVGLFPAGCKSGIGVILGNVAGGMFVIDVEYEDFGEELESLIQEFCPGLLGRYPRIETPGKGSTPGRHLYFRFDGCKSLKLAEISNEESIRRTGAAGHTTAIEIRGEGSYIAVPGGNPAQHKSGKPYRLLDGSPSIWDAPPLTVEQFETICQLCRLLSLQAIEKATSKYVKDQERLNRGGGGDRPGDKLNTSNIEFEELLKGYFTKLSTHNGVDYYRRVGKEIGISATAGYAKSNTGDPLFYCFSTNAPPFQAGRCYDKFGVYTLLKFNGDFREAAKSLSSSQTTLLTKHTMTNHIDTNSVATPKSRSGACLAVTPFSEIKIEPVEWLIPNFLPAAKPVILAGNGGIGKSFLLAQIAADLSAGRCTLGMEYPNPSQGDTLFLTSEDGPSDTIKPRLLGCKADMNRVHFLNGVQSSNGQLEDFSLEYLDLLNNYLESHPETRLIVLDPISHLFALAGADENRESDVRLILRKISAIIEKHKVTCIAVKHLRKTSSEFKDSPVDSVMGSKAYTNFVRIMLHVDWADSNQTIRKISTPKRNLPTLSELPIEIYYTVESIPPDEALSLLEAHPTDPRYLPTLAQEIARIQWSEKPAEVSQPTDRVKSKTRGEQCWEFLELNLAPLDEWHYSQDVLTVLKQYGYNSDHLTSAKKHSKGRLLSAKGEDGKHYWMLKSLPSSGGTPSSEVPKFGSCIRHPDQSAECSTVTQVDPSTSNV